MKNKKFIIICILIAVACVVVGFLWKEQRLVFGAIAAASITTGLICDLRAQRKDKDK